jgi:hypothetical protein
VDWHKSVLFLQISKGLEVKFSDESLSSPAKGVTPSIKFIEGPCADENTAEFSKALFDFIDMLWMKY